MRNGLVALSAPDGMTLIRLENKDVLGWQFYDAKGQPQGDVGSAPSPGGRRGRRRPARRQVSGVSVVCEGNDRIG